MGREEVFREAMELYRDARLELKWWSGKAADDEQQFYIDELEESLLDLKQSVIDLRAADTAAFNGEVNLLLAELRARREE